MTQKLLVPDIGDFEKVEVSEILIKEGEEIKKNDPIVTIESDKSSVEIPSSIEGKVEKLHVKIGDKVSKGDLLLITSNQKSSVSSSEDVPKNTENLIQEAEISLKKNQEKIPDAPTFQAEKEKIELVQYMSEMSDEQRNAEQALRATGHEWRIRSICSLIDASFSI